MEGLTAKVFRTFNASKTLQEQLQELTNEDDSVTGKMLSYNRANRAVAILCNHQVCIFVTEPSSSWVRWDFTMYKYSKTPETRTYIRKNRLTRFLEIWSL